MSLFAIHEGKDEAIIKYDKVVQENQAAENVWTLKDFPKFTEYQLSILTVQKQAEMGPQRMEKLGHHNRLSKVSQSNNFLCDMCDLWHIWLWHVTLRVITMMS